MYVSEVRLASDAYRVCLQHALVTEKEEVMGLLVGKFSEGKEVVCDIYCAVTLRRSDKRKDRVEISPEMLIEAQHKAEEMSASSEHGQLHIVGWYHSHPHITVWPSDVDLQTQAGYQRMESRFIGLIFSVYNEDKKTMRSTYEVSCFQATNQSPEGEAAQYVQLSIPLEIVSMPCLSISNQQALVDLCDTLYEEQMEFLEVSRQHAEEHPIQHLHNVAVTVSSVCKLSTHVLGPLVASVEAEIEHLTTANTQLEEEVAYLEKVLTELKEKSHE